METSTYAGSDAPCRVCVLEMQQFIPLHLEEARARCARLPQCARECLMRSDSRYAATVMRWIFSKKMTWREITEHGSEDCYIII